MSLIVFVFVFVVVVVVVVVVRIFVSRSQRHLKFKNSKLQAGQSAQSRKT